MSERERMMKLLAANPATLARVDAVLDGKGGGGQDGGNDADLTLLTYAEAARRLNLSRPTVYRLAAKGRLTAVPLTSGTKRITLASVRAFVKAQEV